MKVHRPRSLWFVLSLLCLAATVGCGGANWQVMRQASPNPFRGAATFTLLPLDVTQMTIDGEPAASWLAHNPTEASGVPGDIQEAASHFPTTALEHAHGAFVPQGGTYGVRARIVAWQRGSYNAWRPTQTRVSVDAQIVDAQGQVLDEIRLERFVSHPLFRPTPVQGLETALEEIGEDVGNYVNHRRTAMLGHPHHAG